MAAVTVTADNTRVAEAEATPDTGTWGNDGGGGGVSDEPDIVYQGSHAQSRKVSTSPIGRDYTHGSGTSMTATDRRHWIAKVNATNSNALLSRASPALYVKIGSSSSAYYGYRLFGNDNYPPRGGWQFVPISPNVSGYRDAGEGSGSPTLTSILYWSIVADFSATSKSENLIIDAIDIGAGLHLVGGDGADTDAVMQDFIDADQGTVEGGRLGYAYTDEFGKTFFANGRWSIGENTSESAVATVLQDATAGTVVWGNGYAETGFHRLRLNLGSATTDIDLTGWTFDSAGKEDNDADRGYTTTEDTRLVFEVTGTSGDGKLIACFFPNLAQAILTSAVSLDGCDVRTPDLTQAGAEIFGGTKIRTTSATQVAAIDDPTFGTTTDLRDTEFIQEGAGHAIEIDTVGTYDLQDILFTDYGGTPGTNLTPSSGANNAAVLNSSGGLVTINVNGGDSPSIRNTAVSTTQVNNTKTLEVKNVVPGSTVTILAGDTGPETEGDILLSKPAVSEATNGNMLLDGSTEHIETDIDVDMSSASGDLEIIALLRPTDWSPVGSEYIISQRGATQALTSFGFYMLGTGRLGLSVGNGSAETFFQSNIHSLLDAKYAWVRVVYDHSLGQAFFYSGPATIGLNPDDVPWTAQGSPTGTARLMTNVNEPILIGAWNPASPSGHYDGRIAYVVVWKDSITQGFANKVIECEWRAGPDFVGGERKDDHDDRITWQENGTPVYTTHSAANLDVTGSYAYTSDQSIVGQVRSSSFPDGDRYDEFPFVGTIDSNGFTVTAVQARDPNASAT
jgi:hypothetical protein